MLQKFALISHRSKSLFPALLLSVALLPACGSEDESSDGGDDNTQQSLELPQAYTTLSCGTCHGENGESETYAKLAGTTSTLAKWTSTIRNGADNVMPAYTEAQISDADIEAMRNYFAAQ